MQSQQKKVKWSRGETASALEERTDTGITEVSVALMENCMADIYGNISRRPALKLIPMADQNISMFGFGAYMQNPTVFPFYISEDDFVLVFVQSESPLYSVRVKNGTIVSEANSGPISVSAFSDDDHISYAQQNNYMIVACDKWISKIKIELQSTVFTPEAYGITLEPFVFSGNWYAPNGTQTKAVRIATVEWNKDKQGFTSYTYTDKNGESTVWSYIDAGTTTVEGLNDIINNIPLGSILQFPNNGAYMRFEGISVIDITSSQILGNIQYKFIYPEINFDGTLTPSDTVPSTGKYIQITNTIGVFNFYENGALIESRKAGPYVMVVANSTFKRNGANTWVDVADPEIGIYGPLLTPAAASDKTDTDVNVEYGFVNLTPQENARLPAPSVLCFSDQRLWAGGWNIASADDQYALVIGSQIARYNDFKNDYNLDNEAITLDILTKYKEDVLHLVDYNGLKLFTTGAEWAYADGQPVKQSTNGSLRQCEPIVFGSLCLYADQTGGQIRAMQYEFQNNLFDSTVINQMTPGDLIWQPIAMAQYEDKVNNTGRHLFVLNDYSTTNPRIATSNFVPGNQAAIWSRWKTQDITGTYFGTKSLIAGVINTRKYPIFVIINCANYTSTQANYPFLRFAVLDFEAEADLMAPIVNGKYALASNWREAVLPNVTVAVYSNGVYQYETTTDNTGTLVRQPTGLSNVTVGMPINARVVSHPIDVGGKTKTITKRIAKAVMSVRNTEPGAVTINSKTGYMNPAQDTINFYGVTGMKREIIYTITNNKGAKFTIESLTMNIEYGTLIS